ncbi:MAG: TPM domain-containing protein [Treponema sp.]|nr:TPM domain-containing protein [Treponema sp.]MBR6913329.1 TPM domain-containing protein [Treponema sp.]
MKKLNILLKFATIIFFTTQAFAEVHLYDNANLLSQESKMKVESTLSEYSDKHGVGIYIATIYDFRGMFDRIESAAENFFDKKNLGRGETKDGILLFLSMGDRSYDLDTHGISTYCLSDNSDRLECSFLPPFRNNNWEAGFLRYAEEVNAILTANKKETVRENGSFQMHTNNEEFLSLNSTYYGIETSEIDKKLNICKVIVKFFDNMKCIIEIDITAIDDDEILSFTGTIGIGTYSGNPKKDGIVKITLIKEYDFEQEKIVDTATNSKNSEEIVISNGNFTLESILDNDSKIIVKRQLINKPVIYPRYR